MKAHIEMAAIDLESGWTPLEGFPGLEIKYLCNDLDEKACIGSRTRLVKFAPGAKTSSALVHTYWEELYILSGDLYSVSDEGVASAGMSAPRYCLRPPGTPHGPFGSKDGALVFEIQYFLKG
ncbi:cupin domain-containing protein [Paraburkholderia elongata]|uniref:Cupin n=1 Tax=Paraburkholderia elongata TaxID=2675747 RepID=A0A972SER7_9BURK|nr:cupin [Paraburkholderia elongata]NPT53068.1 cupin [Paraburkholderia elongata]